MTIPRSVTFVRLTLVAALAGTALSGCYVVPLGQPAPAVPSSQSYAVAPGPAAQTFNARLYPSNPEAARYGAVAGTVTNDMNGRGHFNAQIGGEQFQGEATRVAGSRGTGVALTMKTMIWPSRDLRMKATTELSESWKSIHSKPA